MVITSERCFSSPSRFVGDIIWGVWPLTVTWLDLHLQLKKLKLGKNMYKCFYFDASAFHRTLVNDGLGSPLLGKKQNVPQWFYWATRSLFCLNHRSQSWFELEHAFSLKSHCTPSTRHSSRGNYLIVESLAAREQGVEPWAGGNKTNHPEQTGEWISWFIH